MDDIQAEIHARRRGMPGIVLEDYERTIGSRAFWPTARSTPNPPARRSTFSQRSEATYARTKSQQPFYQSHASLTVPPSVYSYPTASNYSGISVPLASWIVLMHRQILPGSPNRPTEQVESPNVSTETQGQQDRTLYARIEPTIGAGLLINIPKPSLSTTVCLLIPGL
jgi:hypothetical protein